MRTMFNEHACLLTSFLLRRIRMTEKPILKFSQNDGILDYSFKTIKHIHTNVHEYSSSLSDSFRKNVCEGQEDQKLISKEEY